MERNLIVKLDKIKAFLQLHLGLSKHIKWIKKENYWLCEFYITIIVKSRVLFTHFRAAV